MSSVDERARHHLYHALEQSLGSEDAGTLMNLLPSSDWANVATQTQLEAGLAGVRAELEGLRHTTDLRFDAVDRRFDEVAERFDAMGRDHDRRFDEVAERFDAMGRDHDQRFATKADMHDAFNRQTRTIVFAMIGAMTAYTGVILAALHGAVHV